MTLPMAPGVPWHPPTPDGPGGPFCPAGPGGPREGGQIKVIPLYNDDPLDLE